MATMTCCTVRIQSVLASHYPVMFVDRFLRLFCLPIQPEPQDWQTAFDLSRFQGQYIEVPDFALAIANSSGCAHRGKTSRWMIGNEPSRGIHKSGAKSVR